MKDNGRAEDRAWARGYEDCTVRLRAGYTVASPTIASTAYQAGWRQAREDWAELMAH